MRHEITPIVGNVYAAEHTDRFIQAIRKKLENELSRKKSGATRLRQSRKQVPGTVSALKPLQALTVSESMLVIEAAQLMAAKRCDCVLVVDEDDHLSGIFTVMQRDLKLSRIFCFN